MLGITFKKQGSNRNMTTGRLNDLLIEAWTESMKSKHKGYEQRLYTETDFHERSYLARKHAEALKEFYYFMQDPKTYIIKQYKKIEG